MQIFLDANILFSAAVSPDGAVSRLLTLLRGHDHNCWADSYVILEAHRNVAAKKPAGLRPFAQLVETIQIVPASPQQTHDFPKAAASLPEKDRFVLAAAIRCACDALLTGDRAHFGPLYGRTISGVTIHSPASLTDLLFPA